MLNKQDDSKHVGQVESVVPPRMVDDGSKSGAVPPASCDDIVERFAKQLRGKYWEPRLVELAVENLKDVMREIQHEPKDG